MRYFTVVIAVCVIASCAGALVWLNAPSLFEPRQEIELALNYGNGCHIKNVQVAPSDGNGLIDITVRESGMEGTSREDVLLQLLTDCPAITITANSVPFVDSNFGCPILRKSSAQSDKAPLPKFTEQIELNITSKDECIVFLNFADMVNSLTFSKRQVSMWLTPKGLEVVAAGWISVSRASYTGSIVERTRSLWNERFVLVFSSDSRENILTVLNIFLSTLIGAAASAVFEAIMSIENLRRLQSIEDKLDELT